MMNHPCQAVCFVDRIEKAGLNARLFLRSHQLGRPVRPTLSSGISSRLSWNNAIRTRVDIRLHAHRQRVWFRRCLCGPHLAGGIS